MTRMKRGSPGALWATAVSAALRVLPLFGRRMPLKSSCRSISRRFEQCRQTAFRLIVAGLNFTFLCANTQAASQFYDFVETDTGTVLATIELASLPATHNEVVSLTFPIDDPGNFIDLPSPYPGVFTHTTGSFVDDGINGLTGGSISDRDPPRIPAFDGTLTGHLTLGASEGGGVLHFDVDVARPGGAVDLYDYPGLWTLVPEPTSLTLLVSAGCLALALRQRHPRLRA